MHVSYPEPGWVTPLDLPSNLAIRGTEMHLACGAVQRASGRNLWLGCWSQMVQKGKAFFAFATCYRFHCI